jgi:A/G-specific adenine glycosylase
VTAQRSHEAGRDNAPGAQQVFPQAQPDFAARIVAWQARHGRHDLPWQNTRDAYRIWVSEIMLQQTQVAAVIPFYRRFMDRFPDVPALAGATQDAVLEHWSGLGYYARGRNLHRAAQIVMEQYAGQFPRTLDAIAALPGIGRSTAAAICVFAYGARAAILDGNVKRVLARHQSIEGYPGHPPVQDRLWHCAEALLPESGLERYTQGLMDLGSRICLRTKPACGLCPVAGDCAARIAGSIARLPTPRPTRVLPQRHTTMLILQHAREVLLERRPASGIWGGLWSFPQTEQADFEQTLAQFCVDVRTVTRLQSLEHGFTHYKLRIDPVLIEVGRPALRAGEAGCIWLSMEDALGSAIPTPVRRILRALSACSTGAQLALYGDAG